MPLNPIDDVEDEMEDSTQLEGLEEEKHIHISRR